MRRSVGRWGAVAILASAAMVLAACDGGTATHAATPARPYLLYTHCGIDEARIGNHYYQAVHPLSDGQGNPPAGWANPYQAGTMTLLAPDNALFRDDVGHRVLFRLRPGATSFLPVCS